MIIKTSELIGPALDWAVAKATSILPDEIITKNVLPGGGFNPSINWAQGGLIIEREGMCIEFDREWVYDPNKVDPEDTPDNGDRWLATIPKGADHSLSEYGPTPLIAAMRCYVAAKLGTEVEVPDELITAWDAPMPRTTLPHTRRVKTVLQAVRPYALGSLWCAAAAMGTVALIELCEQKFSIWNDLQVQATMDAAREAKVVELCGGIESVRLTLANGDVQCYTKRGKKTITIKKESLK